MPDERDQALCRRGRSATGHSVNPGAPFVHIVHVTSAVGLAIGSRVGSYEVTAALGRGGMGEVYRARDTRLHRNVALKILPEAFARDPDRRARFEREARLLASLNHPHIAGIYGIEDVPAGEGAPVNDLPGDSRLPRSPRIPDAGNEVAPSAGIARLWTRPT